MYPVANFSYTENNEYFSASEASTQSGSKVNISSVVDDEVYLGVVKSYKVTGTFQCKVAKSGGADVSITDGTFVLRYTEDY